MNDCVMQGPALSAGPFVLCRTLFATRVNARGKYLIPGLSEMHGHLSAYNAHDSARSKLELATLAANGVTTVRIVDLGPNDGGELALGWRPLAATGAILSPRIYTSGMWGRFDSTNSGKRMQTRPEEVAGQIAAYKAAGFDHVKYHWDVDTRTPQGRVVWDSLVAATRRVGLPIMGHPPANDNELSAMSSLEHSSGVFATRAIFAELKKASPDYGAMTAMITARIATLKRAGVWLCPTSSVDGITPEPLSALSGDKKKETWLYYTALKIAHDAGIRFLSGTDKRDPKMITNELRVFVAAGLTTYEALTIGTRNVAEFYGTLAESGTVAVSKRADLVLINGNPLADLQHLLQPAGVMLGGRWYPREELDRRLTELRATVTP